MVSSGGTFPAGAASLQEQGYQYAPVFSAPGASHALLEGHGSRGFSTASRATAVGGVKASPFARACPSAEQIITHRNKFLRAFSFAIFRLVSCAKLLAHPLPNVLPLYE